MPYTVLERKLRALPQPALEEVSLYIDYVFFKFTSEKKRSATDRKKKGFGCLKDIPCTMAPNFDEPLEEFEEYT